MQQTSLSLFLEQALLVGTLHSSALEDMSFLCCPYGRKTPLNQIHLLAVQCPIYIDFSFIQSFNKFDIREPRYVCTHFLYELHALDMCIICESKYQIGRK